jgi:hypothetical protein
MFGRLRRTVTAAEIAVLSDLLTRLQANVAPSEESS